VLGMTRTRWVRSNGVITEVPPSRFHLPLCPPNFPKLFCPVQTVPYPLNFEFRIDLREKQYNLPGACSA